MFTNIFLKCKSSKNSYWDSEEKSEKKIPLNIKYFLDFVYIENSCVHIFPGEIQKLT